MKERPAIEERLTESEPSWPSSSSSSRRGRPHLNDPSRTSPSNPSISRSRVRLIIAILQEDGGSGGGEVGRSATVVCRFDCVRVKKADDSRGSRRGDRSSSSNPDRRCPHLSRVWVAGRMAGTGCSDVRHRDVLLTDTWAHVSSLHFSLILR